MYVPGEEHPRGFWHELWPDPITLSRALRDPAKRVRVPDGVRVMSPTPEDVDALCADPRWALWIWNPDLDFIVPPPGASLQHWTNMVLTPLHAPCHRGLKHLGPALLQRIMHGEVRQSRRRRFISHLAPK